MPVLFGAREQSNYRPLADPRRPGAPAQPACFAAPAPPRTPRACLPYDVEPEHLEELLSNPGDAELRAWFDAQYGRAAGPDRDNERYNPQLPGYDPRRTAMQMFAPRDPSSELFPGYHAGVSPREAEAAVAKLKVLQRDEAERRRQLQLWQGDAAAAGGGAGNATAAEGGGGLTGWRPFSPPAIPDRALQHSHRRWKGQPSRAHQRYPGRETYLSLSTRERATAEERRRIPPVSRVGPDELVTEPRLMPHFHSRSHLECKRAKAKAAIGLANQAAAAAADVAKARERARRRQEGLQECGPEAAAILKQTVKTAKVFSPAKCTTLAMPPAAARVLRAAEQ
eukprot:SAG22_NODE_3694_length_1572_cov_1.556687_2_plen_338_part_01